MSTCPVCAGARFIRLPYRQPMQSAYARELNAMGDTSPMHRDYPCPECSETVSLDRVAVLQHTTEVGQRYSEELDYLKPTAAQMMLRMLLEKGFTTFAAGPLDQSRFPNARFFRATLGVVSPKVVATIEERVAARQFEVAQDVVQRAELELAWWASSVGGTHIPKAEAARIVRESLEVIRRQRTALVDPTARL